MNKPEIKQKDPEKGWLLKSSFDNPEGRCHKKLYVYGTEEKCPVGDIVEIDGIEYKITWRVPINGKDTYGIEERNS